MPNYFDVTVWGAQGENCGHFLSKGRGRSPSTAACAGASGPTAQRQKRQAVDIIAETVQFLGGREDAGNGNGFSSSARATESDVPIDTGDFERTPVGAGADDDIPF